MLAHEGKPGLAVVKICRWRPGRCAVARLARCPDRSSMFVRMTRYALRGQSLKCLMGMGCESFCHIGIFDVLRRVALLARFRFMRTGQRESGFCVVKLRFVEPRDLCVDSQVLLVTRDARAGRIEEMKTVTALYLVVDLDVARQALCAVYLLTAFMALRAVGDPLKVGVRPGQRTR